PTVQPSDTVNVRLYLSESEVNELLSAGALSSFENLNVTKVPGAVCSSIYPGGGESVTLRGVGTYGSGYYVDVGVTNFSEFFFHSVSEPLENTTAVTENGRQADPWGVAPNPVVDRLRLTPPPSLVGETITAEAIDALGRRVLYRVLPSASHHDIDTRAWRRGTYVLVLTGGDQRTSVRVMK
ncbi:MAG: T9SS type A sorting domain-containing protein, partial [Lewinella sp.]